MPGPANEKKKPGSRINLEQLQMWVRRLGPISSELGRQGLVGGVRKIMPIIEGYAHSRDPSQPPISKGNKNTLSEDESKALNAAGAKLLYELIECSSKIYPVMDDVQPYVAKLDPETKRYPAPKLCHILSLVRAGTTLLNSWAQKKSDPGLTEKSTLTAQRDDTWGRSVLLTAVAPGKYITSEGPFPPQQIRRSAMSHKLYPPTHQQPNTIRGTEAVSAVENRTADTSCCCQGTRTPTTTMARYTEEGECENLFSVSCETQWRIRNCFKQILCDVLYCLGSNMCEDGQLPEDADYGEIFGSCFETALCSLVRCLPDAICGPRPTVCEKIKPMVDCNYAVEEVD